MKHSWILFPSVAGICLVLSACSAGRVEPGGDGDQIAYTPPAPYAVEAPKYPTWDPEEFERREAARRAKLEEAKEQQAAAPERPSARPAETREPTPPEPSPSPRTAKESPREETRTSPPASTYSWEPATDPGDLPIPPPPGGWREPPPRKPSRPERKTDEAPSDPGEWEKVGPGEYRRRGSGASSSSSAPARIAEKEKLAAARPERRSSRPPEPAARAKPPAAKSETWQALQTQIADQAVDAMAEPPAARESEDPAPDTGASPEETTGEDQTAEERSPGLFSFLWTGSKDAPEARSRKSAPQNVAVDRDARPVAAPPDPPQPKSDEPSRPAPATEATWNELQEEIENQRMAAAAVAPDVPDPADATEQSESIAQPEPEQADPTDDPDVSPMSSPVSPGGDGGSDEAPSDLVAARTDGRGDGPFSRAVDHDRRLAALAKERLAEPAAAEYRIGPGDLLEINVFDLPELTRTTRVSGAGYIQLPLLGAVPAKGKSESELDADLERRLGESYLQDPEASVFILEYNSRQIAVTGAVAEPGVYPLNRGGMTLLDAISEAGGATKDSGGLIEFIPAADGRSPEVFQVASTSEMIGQGLDRRDIARSNAIRIGLNELMRGASQAALNLPVRAGDVIHVAETGQFTVQGWVENPGSYDITRDSTVLAAITTAGGALFPAKTNRVQILRSYGESGVVREVIEVDIGAIRDGEASDIPLEPGDVVDVDSYKTLLPAWAVYSLFRSIISVGAGIPLT